MMKGKSNTGVVTDGIPFACPSFSCWTLAPAPHQKRSEGTNQNDSDYLKPAPLSTKFDTGISIGVGAFALQSNPPHRR